jgi:DtxR family Mn-dependent transcriptional regulator
MRLQIIQGEPMTEAAHAMSSLTGALEHYLETIFLEVRRQGFARVRDIAKARDVKSSSVSVALGRLADLGLVRYIQREYVGLTDTGEEAARRVLARHELLSRFFHEILQMEPQAAEREACSMEHSLSPAAMDRFARFFEFLNVCPTGQMDWLQRFHACTLVHGTGGACEHACTSRMAVASPAVTPMVTLALLAPGQRGRVQQVNSAGAVRQPLLDLGLLPDVAVQVERVAPSGDPMWIRVGGSQMALRRREAEAVVVERV